LRYRVHKIGARAIATALHEPKKRVPGVQPELPALPRIGRVRRPPAQYRRQPDRGRRVGAGLLPLAARGSDTMREDGRR
jgi:hypothetical protein